MVSTIKLSARESLVIEPQPNGVRLHLHFGMARLFRDLPCESASALLFALEMALEASDCANIRDAVPAKDTQVEQFP